MTAKNTPGDLTDVRSWERAWNRARGPRTATHRSRHDAFIRHLISRASEIRRGPLRIVELGCAPGKKLRDMARIAPEHAYSGVDFAPRALEETRRVLAASGLSPHLHLADVREFEPDEPYDIVVSFGLLEHFDDPASMLAHHVRLARPGGVVGFELPNYRHRVLARALAVYSPETLATHNLEIMTLDAIHELAADSGLTEVETGSYGGAVAPVSRAEPGIIGASARLFATAWNIAVRVLPSAWHPWQGFLWACGRRPG